MRIIIVGGGPAGLYFALLMKKESAAHRVTLFERNAPGDTFGWGVVFSDKTLSYLGESDPPTHRAITSRFATWENVDVVHRDQRVTIRGNRFSGIARIELLNILQQRCLELGVDVRFGSEIHSLSHVAREADLLVGADGVNSLVRQTYQSELQPSLDFGLNKYIWYGTPQLFHGLTLTFRENAAGLFSAHSYKFNETTSTFIVECDPETWGRAGFDRMDDTTTRSYLETVFAADLDGQPLLSNNSRWINFVNVRNRHWIYGNTVLLGDALHTAHFSIGSGTKLALEDAIALSRCLREAHNLDADLAKFEEERKPVIEAYQEAAAESRVWFENVKKYFHLAPLPFAYSLMTRSKKIDHENLRRRDPQFIAAYEGAISRAEAG